MAEGGWEDVTKKLKQSLQEYLENTEKLSLSTTMDLARTVKRIQRCGDELETLFTFLEIFYDTVKSGSVLTEKLWQLSLPQMKAVEPSTSDREKKDLEQTVEPSTSEIEKKNLEQSMSEHQHLLEKLQNQIQRIGDSTWRLGHSHTIVYRASEALEENFNELRKIYRTIVGQGSETPAISYAISSKASFRSELQKDATKKLKQSLQEYLENTKKLSLSTTMDLERTVEYIQCCDDELETLFTLLPVWEIFYDTVKSGSVLTKKLWQLSLPQMKAVEPSTSDREKKDLEQSMSEHRNLLGKLQNQIQRIEGIHLGLEYFCCIFLPHASETLEENLNQLRKIYKTIFGKGFKTPPAFYKKSPTEKCSTELPRSQLGLWDGSLSFRSFWRLADRSQSLTLRGRQRTTGHKIYSTAYTGEDMGKKLKQSFQEYLENLENLEKLLLSTTMDLAWTVKHMQCCGDELETHFTFLHVWEIFYDTVKSGSVLTEKLWQLRLLQMNAVEPSTIDREKKDFEQSMAEHQNLLEKLQNQIQTIEDTSWGQGYSSSFLNFASEALEKNFNELRKIYRTIFGQGSETPEVSYAIGSKAGCSSDLWEDATKKLKQSLQEYLENTKKLSLRTTTDLARTVEHIQHCDDELETLFALLPVWEIFYDTVKSGSVLTKKLWQLSLPQMKAVEPSTSDREKKDLEQSMSEHQNLLKELQNQLQRISWRLRYSHLLYRATEALEENFNELRKIYRTIFGQGSETPAVSYAISSKASCSTELHKWQDEAVRNCTTCGKEQDSTKWLQQEASVSSEGDQVTYRIKVPPGCYECPITGLRWKNSCDVKLQYFCSNWEQLSEVLQTQQFQPCGPLIDITVLLGKLDAVYLPHFLCQDSELSLQDEVRVIHVEDAGVSLEKCELTRFHAKLLQISFSPKGLLVRSGLRVKVHCDVLIYQVLGAHLTLHIYLVPSDCAMKKAVENEEKGKAVKISKPNPESSLQMKSWFKMKTTHCDPEITPDLLKLRYTSNTPNFFEVYIKNPPEDFDLQLLTETDELIWKAKIRLVDMVPSSDGGQQIPFKYAVYFVKKHENALIQRISLVTPIADDLKDLIGDEKYSIIRKTQTTEDQMRELYSFLSGGEEIMYRFYLSLLKNEPYLVTELAAKTES